MRAMISWAGRSGVVFCFRCLLDLLLDELCVFENAGPGDAIVEALS